MAYHNNLFCQSFEANADLSNFKYRVVELLSTGKVALAALGKGYGVLQNIPKSTEMATVAIEGQTLAIAGGTISIADHTRATSGGWLVKANSGDLNGIMLMGQAMTAAASGGLFTVDLRPQVMANVVSGSIAQALP
jgi:hypothetical protein